MPIEFLKMINYRYPLLFYALLKVSFSHFMIFLILKKKIVITLWYGGVHSAYMVKTSKFISAKTLKVLLLVKILLFFDSMSISWITCLCWLIYLFLFLDFWQMFPGFLRNSRCQSSVLWANDIRLPFQWGSQCCSNLCHLSAWSGIQGIVELTVKLTKFSSSNVVCVRQLWHAYVLLKILLSFNIFINLLHILI